MVEIGDRSAAPTDGADFVERHLEAAGLRLSYLESGQGSPLVLLPGPGGLQFSRAHDLLAERFRLIAPQLTDFERSRSSQTLAATIAAALASLGLERYSLLGSSTGGQVALRLALQFPERVEALVLEAPTAIRPEAPGDPELERRLGALQVPVLVVFGTRDRLIPAEMGRLYREKLPNCHFVLVYDAGHAIGAERPEAFASLVGDFLERREQFVVTRVSGLLHP